MKNLAERVNPSTEENQNIDKFFPFGAVGFSVAEINSALTSRFGNTGLKIDRKYNPRVEVEQGVKNPVKKDYAPQFNKKLETRSVTAKEVFEMVSLAVTITFGTYIILGFLGLL